MNSEISTKTPFVFHSGKPKPFGATISDSGVNFSVISSTASSLSLCLYEDPKQISPSYEIPFDPHLNRTGHVWHIFIEGLPHHLLYAYRVDHQLEILLDPYALSLVTTQKWGGNSNPDQSSNYQPLGGFVSSKFDWEGDRSPNIPKEKWVIYEMHIRGFTQHASSQVASPGTFNGVAEKAAHLKSLGINAVEILPCFEFNECEYFKVSPVAPFQRLYNYWGYSTVGFFAPMQRYATTGKPQAVIDEFKEMVKTLHRHGIEVILDLVYNHTAESGDPGPVYSFKGLDNQIYYMLDKEGKYLNFTGCGNTFNCNHPINQELILDSLRYWVTEMHVDGFRFDLASTFTRDKHGKPQDFSPIIDAITHDPILATIKLIAEPWDAAGLYQVGSFISFGNSRWSEWNGRYRDVVRSFIKGTGAKGIFTTNICGSQDFYHSASPACSINFVTAHDGFTLYDLVSYNRKHNLENGEDNRDGMNDNESWNCGVEGPTEDPIIIALRNRQMRNFHLALMVSLGIPMVHMGDEYAHTKRGNNNSWCQDNGCNWFNWSDLEKNQEFFRYYSGLIRFRIQSPLLTEAQFLTPEDIEFHGKKLGQPNWDKEDRMIAYTLIDRLEGNNLYVAFNASELPVQMELPSSSGDKNWYWVVNTANASPDDFIEGLEMPVKESTYEMLPYSAIMLKMRCN